MKPARAGLIKGLLLSFAFLIIVLVAAAALFIYFFPKKTIRDLVVSNLVETLDRKVELGELNYALGGVALKGVVLYNGKSEDDGIMVRADSVILRFSMADLLKKELNINRIFLENLDIYASFDKEGVSNIERLIRHIAEQEKSELTTRISNVHLNNGRLIARELPEDYRPLRGTWGINCIINLVDEEIIAITDCAINLPEKNGKVLPDIYINTGKGKFAITGTVKLEDASLLWVYEWGNQPLPFNRVTGIINDLKIDTEYVQGFVKASSTLTNSRKVAHADGFTKVGIFRETVLLSNVQGSVESSSFLINRLLLTHDGDPVDFNITNMEARYGDIYPMLHFVLPEKLYGGLAGNLSYEKDRFTGRMKLTNLGYDMNAKIFSDVNTEIAFRDNMFKKEDIPLKIYGFPAVASAASTDSSLKSVILNITSDSFDTAPFLKDQGDGKVDLGLPFNLRGRLAIKKATHREYTFGDCQINYSVLQNETLVVNGFSTDFMGGTVTGSGTIPLTASPAKISTILNFSDLKVQDFLSGSQNLSGRFYGIARGSAAVDFTLGGEIYKSITGSIEFTIDEGKVVNTGIQNALGVWLKELKYKLIDLEFNTIYGNFLITGDDYKINQFVFKSPNIRLIIKGTFDKKLVAKPIVLVLEFNRQFLEDMPNPIVRLRFDKYLKGDWYMIPFTIIGDMTDSKSLKRR